MNLPAILVWIPIYGLFAVTFGHCVFRMTPEVCELAVSLCAWNTYLSSYVNILLYKWLERL